jgi:hypothetical protein
LMAKSLSPGCTLLYNGLSGSIDLITVEAIMLLP